MAYKYYLFPNQNWRDYKVYLYFCFLSPSLSIFSSQHSYNQATENFLLLNFEINKLPSLRIPELATGQ